MLLRPFEIDFWVTGSVSGVGEPRSLARFVNNFFFVKSLAQRTIVFLFIFSPLFDVFNSRFLFHAHRLLKNSLVFRKLIQYSVFLCVVNCMASCVNPTSWPSSHRANCGELYGKLCGTLPKVYQRIIHTRSFKSRRKAKAQAFSYYSLGKFLRNLI